MKPQRVALVARPAQGGIRSHLILLSKHLSPEFSPRLIAPQSLLDSLPEWITENARPLAVTSRISPSDLLTAWRLAQGISVGELVHAHGIRAGWISLLARGLRRFPLVVTFHNLPPSNLFGRFATAFICRRADRVIAVSNAIAASLPVEMTRIIPNGIEIDRFQSGERSEARMSLKIDQRAFVVGCVARLSHEKGVDVLLKTAALFPEIHFVIVGDGPDRPDLEKMALPNAQFLGQLEDIVPALKAFDLLVIPSRSEGQGIVALEAFASGCPVIASRVGGLPEAIRDGVTGILIDPDSVGSLLGAIERVAADAPLRQTLRENAHEYVKQFGTVEQMCRSVEATYRETLGMNG